MRHMKQQDNGYAAQLVRLRTGREIPELLREMYVDERHSQREIAEALGVSRSQVGAWLQRYELSRDDRRPAEVREATA